jgi:hypothetical protein
LFLQIPVASGFHHGPAVLRPAPEAHGFYPASNLPAADPPEEARLVRVGNMLQVCAKFDIQFDMQFDMHFDLLFDVQFDMHFDVQFHMQFDIQFHIGTI